MHSTENESRMDESLVLFHDQPAREQLFSAMTTAVRVVRIYSWFAQILAV
jgi:hypothetical protein